MPKSGVRDLRLFRFDGTDLYAWWGKNGTDPENPGWTFFEYIQTEPFVIRQAALPDVKDDGAVDKVMAVLNYWFDGTRRINRDSDMVRQLAALVVTPQPNPAEEALREAREQLQAIAELSGDRAVPGFNEAGRLSRINERSHQALTKIDAVIGGAG